MTSYLYSLLSKSLSKPVKIDVRNVCEHNFCGPITRTFNIPRKELVSILTKTDNGENEIIDRVDVTEYEEETRAVIYNSSQMDHPSIPSIRKMAEESHEWDLEPQYGEWS